MVELTQALPLYLRPWLLTGDVMVTSSDHSKLWNHQKLKQV